MSFIVGSPITRGFALSPRRAVMERMARSILREAEGEEEEDEGESNEPLILSGLPSACAG